MLISGRTRLNGAYFNEGKFTLSRKRHVQLVTRQDCYELVTPLYANESAIIRTDAATSRTLNSR